MKRETRRTLALYSMIKQNNFPQLRECFVCRFGKKKKKKKKKKKVKKEIAQTQNSEKRDIATTTSGKTIFTRQPLFENESDTRYQARRRLFLVSRPRSAARSANLATLYTYDISVRLENDTSSRTLEPSDERYIREYIYARPSNRFNNI